MSKKLRSIHNEKKLLKLQQQRLNIRVSWSFTTKINIDNILYLQKKKKQIGSDNFASHFYEQFESLSLQMLYIYKN